jgi:hypothetical protein
LIHPAPTRAADSLIHIRHSFAAGSANKRLVLAVRDAVDAAGRSAKAGWSQTNTWVPPVEITQIGTALDAARTSADMRVADETHLRAQTQRPTRDAHLRRTWLQRLDASIDGTIACIAAGLFILLILRWY